MNRTDTCTTDQDILNAIKAGHWEPVPDDYTVRRGDILRRVEVTVVAPKTGIWRLFRLFPVDIIEETLERLVEDR